MMGRERIAFSEGKKELFFHCFHFCFIPTKHQKPAPLVLEISWRSVRAEEMVGIGPPPIYELKQL